MSDTTTPAPAPSTEPEHVPRMTDADLRTFVVEFCNGQIFTSAQIMDDSLLGNVFMPLIFGAFEKASREYVEEIGIVWERLSQAGPRAINGMPTFFSMHIMHRDDWARAIQAIQAEEQRRKEIPLP